jgi:acetyltransferase-like isoleucine patch superfamily enzyme
MEALNRIKDDVHIGTGTRFPGEFVNLYGCTIGNDCMIGAFVEIQADVIVGHRCKVQSHSFICSGVTIEDDVFIGHGVMFINDNHPRAVGTHGMPEQSGDWADRMVRTRVQRGASIGSNATILGGVTIHEGAVVGAGAVVTHDVPPKTTVIGNPARPL